jgi:outer membrane cobalamin receptor
MKYIILIAFLITSIPAIAQFVIKGKVVDAVSRQPLEAVSVSDVNQPLAKTITDPNGNFIIKSGTQLLISYIGYKTINYSVVSNEQNIIALQKEVLNLKDITLQSNAATKFSTVTKIDLDLKPVKNTQELLRLVPGLFIAQHAGGGKAEQIFLRGFDCDHGTDVQVSVDGMPVNMVSHAHGQGYADAHFIIPQTINNIDFGAGPYFAAHGNLNTAGYVAFSTFKNIAHSIVQTEVGRFNTFRTLTMIDLLKKNKDKQSAYIAADYNYTDGPTINHQHFNRFNVFGKYNAAITSSTRLSFSVSSFKSKWNASGQIPERAVASGAIDRFGSLDPSEGGNTERHNANFLLTHDLKKGNWENQLFFTRYAFNLFSNFTFYLNDAVNGDEINQAESRNIFGYASTLHLTSFIGNKTISTVYGAGLRYDATTDSRLSNAVKRIILHDIKRGNIKEANTYAYANKQLNTGKWLIEGGIRIDHFNFNYFDKLTVSQQPAQQKAIVSPKLNIQYTVNEKMQWFIKSGKGFHSNGTRVVVMNEGKQILPAAYGTDLGVILKPAKNLLFHIAAWQLFLDQEFVYVGDDGNVEPSGKTKRQGLDIIARYQLGKKIFTNINVNFTKPRATSEPKGADYIPLAPTLTSVGGLYYKAQKGFNGGINYRYIKNRPANEDNSIVAKGYFLVDAAVNYTRPEYEFGLAVENIFNIKWNEAQFATTSRLQNEPSAITELNFTPGTPFFVRLKLAVFF